MWSRRKEEEPAAKSPSLVPTKTDLTREGIPMSTTPTRVSEPGGGNSAAVGKSVIVKGSIHSREDLYVDGEVEGTIEVQEHRLTVGPNGRVKAHIKAREVVIRGTVHGDILAGGKVEIRKDAKATSDVKTARIVIEDGAYFKGNIDIVRQELTRTAAPQPAARQAPRPAAGAPSRTTAAAASTPGKP
ncbi:MAG: polymer-forming cytoskeletal protein [bacterium]|nr:polymer-forming cytoskeletal protein [bacterium]